MQVADVRQEASDRFHIPKPGGRAREDAVTGQLRPVSFRASGTEPFLVESSGCPLTANMRPAGFVAGLCSGRPWAQGARSGRRAVRGHRLPVDEAAAASAC